MPKVLFIVKARLLPKLLSTCVCSHVKPSCSNPREDVQEAEAQADDVHNGGLCVANQSGTKHACCCRQCKALCALGRDRALQHISKQVMLTHLRGKMHDCVNLFILQHVRYKVHALDVALDKLEVLAASDVSQIVD